MSVESSLPGSSFRAGDAPANSQRFLRQRHSPQEKGSHSLEERYLGLLPSLKDSDMALVSGVVRQRDVPRSGERLAGWLQSRGESIFYIFVTFFHGRRVGLVFVVLTSPVVFYKYLFGC